MNKSLSISLACFLAVSVAPTVSRSEGGLEVGSVSAPAHMVSGGDALIRVRNAEASDLQLSNDRGPVSSTSSQDGTDVLIHVGDLATGANVIEVTDADSGLTGTLQLTNYPIEGPIFSGPHQTPFVCETVEAGLGAPLDANCSANVKVEYVYRSGSSWVPLENPKNPPPNVPTTRTLDGHTVPFIVRIESGTINRGIYRIAILDDGTFLDFGRPSKGWNRKLTYTYGGGCDAGYHQGVNNIDDVLLPVFLQRGYAVATSSLNVGVTNCNDVLSAETTMMVKEHFVETYGVPRYTIGQGGSGGAIQLHLIAENYPGLLDGLLPNSAFPDALSMGPGVTDCGLLNAYFAKSTLPWSEVQRTAVTGFALAPIPVCESIEKAYGDTIIPDKGCRIPAALRYDKVNRPDGARCTIYDHMVTIFGIDPETGFARRPIDNIGVQYGLRALNEGKIAIEQFLDLNEHIGGYDPDANIITSRTRAPDEAIRIAYASGRIVDGRGGLGIVPSITVAGYKDLEGNPHDRFRNFSLRDRLIRSRGDGDTNSIWSTPGGVPGTSVGTPVVVLDQWLEALLADTSQDDQREKVSRAKPGEADDACWLGDRYPESATYDQPGACNVVYRPHAEPRIAAGGPLSNDVLKCALKPIDPTDYPLPLLPTQLERLHQIFPEGVCDFSVPGVHQESPHPTWQSWGNS